MQAHRLPAGHGARWLLEGFRLFRRNPPFITALTLGYLLLIQVVFTILPDLGAILLPVVLPALMLIMGNGCRLTDHGEKPTRVGLLHGLQGNLPAMLRLGGLQLAGAILLLLITMMLGDPAAQIARLEQVAVPNMEVESSLPDASGTTGDERSSDQNRTDMHGHPDKIGPPAHAAAEMVLMGHLMKLMLLSMPLIIAFLFAPFLVGWHGVKPLKSLFFSTVASWRNWRAMLMFGLAVVLFAVIVPSLFLIVISRIADLAFPAALFGLRLFLVLVIAPVLMTSIYTSFRDIFQTRIDETV